MTKRERVSVRQAIIELMVSDGDKNKALRKLCSLIGMTHAKAQELVAEFERTGAFSKSTQVSDTTLPVAHTKPLVLVFMSTPSDSSVGGVRFWRHR
jgi:topoisomerase IA-like protein